MNNDKYNEISRFAAADKRRREAIDRGDVAAAMESAAQMEEAGAALTEKQDPVYSISSCAIPPNPNAGVEAELEAIAAVLQAQAASMKDLNLTQQEHGKSLKSQAEAQQTLARDLASESRNRAKSDKKYFWLGVVASLVTSIAVQLVASLLASAR